MLGDRLLDGDGFLSEQPGWVECENHYRASHEALDADYVLNDEGHTIPMRVLVCALLHRLEEHVDRWGAAPNLARARQLLEDGAGYEVQRRVAARVGSLEAVGRYLVDALEEGLGRL